ncbi:hypothetical protein CLOM_g2515 [Closterium sp. NIES-68]|nr:hypothetical protein CLOM_g2515 [Closterium sp. NIES-68]GJP74286.1 hypothetical protein CLOP_g4894 [Closterium sp. NIES-67]
MATGTEGVGAGGSAFITSLNPAALRAYACAMESGMIGNIWSPTAVGSPKVLSPSAALVTQPNRTFDTQISPNTNARYDDDYRSGTTGGRGPVRRSDSASAAEGSHVVVAAEPAAAAPPSLGITGRSRTSTDAPRVLPVPLRAGRSKPTARSHSRTRSVSNIQTSEFEFQFPPPLAQGAQAEGPTALVVPPTLAQAEAPRTSEVVVAEPAPPSLGTTVAAVAAGRSRTTARSHNRTRSVSSIQFHFPLSLAQGAQGRTEVTSSPTGATLSAGVKVATANDGKAKLARALTERSSGASGAGSRREFSRSHTTSERVSEFFTPLSPAATTGAALAGGTASPSAGRSRSPHNPAASPEMQRAKHSAAPRNAAPGLTAPAPARCFPDLYPDSAGSADPRKTSPAIPSESSFVIDLYPAPSSVFPRFATIGDVPLVDGAGTDGNANANANGKLHPALSRRSRSTGSQSAGALAASMGLASMRAATSGGSGGIGGSAGVGGGRAGPRSSSPASSGGRPVVQLAPRMGFVDWAGIGSPKSGGSSGGTSFGASGGGTSGVGKPRLQALDSSKSPPSASASPRFPVAIPSHSAAAASPAGSMPGSRSLPPAMLPYSAGAPPLSPLGRTGNGVVPRPTHRRAISAAQLSPRVPSPSARLVRPPSSPSVAGKAPGAAANVVAVAAAAAVARSSTRARGVVQPANAAASTTCGPAAEGGCGDAEGTGSTARRTGKPMPMPRSVSADPALAHPAGLEEQAQAHAQVQQLQASSREHVGNYRRAAPAPLAVPVRRRNHSMSSVAQGDAASKSALTAGSAAANGGGRSASGRGQVSPGAGAWPARSPVGTAGGRLEGTSGECRTGVTATKIFSSISSSQQPRARGGCAGGSDVSGELSPGTVAAIAAASAAIGRTGSNLSQTLPARTSGSAQPSARFTYGSTPNSPVKRSRLGQTEAAGSASKLANAVARLKNISGGVTNVTGKTKVGNSNLNISPPGTLSPPTVKTHPGIPTASPLRASPPPVAPSPPRSSPSPVAPARVGYSSQSLSQQQQQQQLRQQQASSRRTSSVDFDARSSNSSGSSSNNPMNSNSSSSSSSSSKSPVRASGRGGAVILTSPCPSPSRAQVVFIDGIPMPLRSALKSHSIDNALGNTGSNLGNTGSNPGNTGVNPEGKVGAGRSNSVSPIFRDGSPLVGRGVEEWKGGGIGGKEEQVLHPQVHASPRRVSFSGFVEVQEYVRESEGSKRGRGRQGGM